MHRNFAVSCFNWDTSRRSLIFSCSSNVALKEFPKRKVNISNAPSTCWKSLFLTWWQFHLLSLVEHRDFVWQLRCSCDVAPSRPHPWRSYLDHRRSAVECRSTTDFDEFQSTRDHHWSSFDGVSLVAARSGHPKKKWNRIVVAVVVAAAAAVAESVVLDVLGFGPVSFDSALRDSQHRQGDSSEPLHRWLRTRSPVASSAAHVDRLWKVAWACHSCSSAERGTKSSASSIGDSGTYWREVAVDWAWVMLATGSPDSRRSNGERRNQLDSRLVMRLTKWMAVKLVRAFAAADDDDGVVVDVADVLEVEQQRLQPWRRPYSVEQVISLRVLVVVKMPWEENHLEFVRVVFYSNCSREDDVVFVNTRFPLFQSLERVAEDGDEYLPCLSLTLNRRFSPDQPDIRNKARVRETKTIYRMTTVFLPLFFLFMTFLRDDDFVLRQLPAFLLQRGTDASRVEVRVFILLADFWQGHSSTCRSKVRGEKSTYHVRGIHERFDSPGSMKASATEKLLLFTLRSSDNNASNLN